MSVTEEFRDFCITISLARFLGPYVCVFVIPFLSVWRGFVYYELHMFVRWFAPSHFIDTLLSLLLVASLVQAYFFVLLNQAGSAGRSSYYNWGGNFCSSLEKDVCAHLSPHCLRKSFPAVDNVSNRLL